MNTIIRLSQRSFALLGVALVAGGCTSTYRFDVDGVKHPSAGAEHRYSYRLVPSNPELAPDDLRIRQAARDVRTALSSKGLFEAPEGTTPQLHVEFDFGIEGPIVVTHTHFEPVVRYGLANPMGGFAVESSGTSQPSIGSGGVEAGLPEYGESRPVTVRTKEYRKFLRLTARRPRPLTDDMPVPVWSVLVENQDESDDLGKYVRLMTAAAMDVIGEDSTTVRSIKLTGRDGRVVFVQTGILE